MFKNEIHRVSTSEHHITLTQILQSHMFISDDQILQDQLQEKAEKWFDEFAYYRNKSIGLQNSLVSYL